MVYCPKCGAENDDDAAVCKSCGEFLRGTRVRTYRRYKDDDACFGSGRGFSWFGLFFGVVIILAGVIFMYEGQYWWASWENLWPMIVVLFGLLIVFSALSRRR